jgi:putative ABC transport system permease protein
VNAARRGPALRPTILYVRGPAAIGPALRAAFEDAPVEVRSRQAELGALRGSPLVTAVGQGFAVALAAAAVYAALAIVAVITLDADRRARELAFLRTLGLTDRQAFELMFVEHGPPAVVALVVGIALGLGIAWLLEPGLGLGAFIGPSAPVRLTVEWAAVVTIALSVLVVVLAMVALSAWLARRLDAARALRIGEA